MNNMTGDPTQNTRSTIFGFDPYPPLGFQSAPIDWTGIPGLPTMQSPVFPAGQFNPAQSQGNFSFCTTQTPHPAQFPFPVRRESGFGFEPQVRCKRKTDSPPLQTCKQHISEEKMAEHLAKLHISSETASTAGETQGERTRRLYMCEEMRKLQSDSILPQSLLSSIQRPCTALVLWTPPRRLIPEDIADNGNNNDEIQDHNSMEMDGM